MNYVITIGREYGSGGRYIAKKLAKRLGINFYDDELLKKISEETGLAEGFVEKYDEKRDAFFSANIGNSNGDVSLSCKVYLAQFEVIKKLAENESCIIIGRCADYILKDHPNVINIFICAPHFDKVQRGITYYGLPSEKAEKIIKKKNKERKKYYEFYSDKEWGNPSSYDLCVNSKVGIDESVDIIESYIKTIIK